MNHDPVLWFGIIGTILWVAFVVMLGWPDMRNTYYKYLRPQIKFSVTKHAEGGQVDVIENKRVPIGVELYFEGYFENNGGKPSTVKAIEAQLVKKYGIFKRPISEKDIKAAYYLEGAEDLIDDHRGVYIGEYSISPKVKADTICFWGENFQIDKLDRNYFFKISWHVLGQEPKETEIYPDWNIFRKDVKSRISRQSMMIEQ